MCFCAKTILKLTTFCVLSVMILASGGFAAAAEDSLTVPQMPEDRKRKLDVDIELYEQSHVPHIFHQVAAMKNDGEDSAQYQMVFSDWTFGSVLEDQEESSGTKTQDDPVLTPSNYSSISNTGDWRVNSHR